MTWRRPHVAHVVCTAAFAGVERYVSLVAPRVAELGWDVTVVGGDPTRMRTELGPEVRYCQGASLGTAAAALVRLRPRPDVVHVHMTSAEIVGVATRPVLRAPVVSTRHFSAVRGASPAGRLVAPVIRRGLAAQVANSRFTAAETGEEMAVLYPGTADSPETTDRSQRSVLMLQRLSWEKHPMEAVEAWAQSGLADDGWRLVIGGNGALRAALEAEIAARDLQSSVELRGEIEDVHAFLLSGSVFLATSRREGFGLSIVEAMARGLAVVATDSGGHRETVADPDLLYPPGDAARCAQALRRICIDDVRRHEVGDRLRCRQMTSFAVDGHVQDLVRLYTDTTGLAGVVGR